MIQKFITAVAVVCVVFLVSLEGAVYKGHILYVKQCKKCHGQGQVFITSKNQATWERMMSNNGEPVAKLHLYSEDAKEVHDYFGSRAWQRHANDLRDFMVEYASDSGNVPACD